ncbi:MAG: hypothetical protein K8J08_06260 [Thermoanaerobaculia bacterium]|nr:hypothetical protein [Thermoanaerobaculia bacterium]
MMRTRCHTNSVCRDLLVGVVLLSLAGTAFGSGRGGDLVAEPFDHELSRASPSPTSPESEPVVQGTTPLTSFRLAGSAFKPRATDVTATTNSNGSCAYAAAGNASTVWNVSPNLPQGAIVDTLRIYYNDTSASNSTAWFTVYDLYGSIAQEWPVSSNTSGGNSFNDSAQINHTVDYGVYSYLVNWRPAVSGSTMQLCGVRLFYVAPTLFSDGFESGNTSAWN